MGRKRDQSSPISLFSFQDIITCVIGIMVLIVLIMILELLSRTENATPPPEQIIEAPSDTKKIQNKVVFLEEEISKIKQKLEKSKNSLDQISEMSPNNIKEQTKTMENELKEKRKLLTDLRIKLKNVEKENEKIISIVNNVEKLQQEKDNLQENISEMEKYLADMILNKRVNYVAEITVDQKHPFLVECLRDKIITASIVDGEKSRIFDNPNESKRLTEFIEWVKSKDEDMEYFLVLIKPSCIKTGNKIIGLIKNEGYDVGFDPIEEDRTVLTW